MKNFFKDYTYTWQQIVIFKITMLSLGILIGSHWAEIFQRYWSFLLVIWVVTFVYMNYISFRSKK